TGDEHVHTVERLGDLRARAFVVRARIRLVRVLEGHEVTGLALGELERESDGAVRAFDPRREDDVRAEEAEQTLSLISRVLRHHAGERIALQLGNEGERDAGVAARRLEQLASPLQLAGSFGGLDHRLGDAVLDRAGRVLALELRVDLNVADRPELDERGVADELEEILCRSQLHRAKRGSTPKTAEDAAA